MSHRCQWTTGLLVLGLTFSAQAVPGSAEENLLSNTRQLTFEGKRAGEGYFSTDGDLMVFQSERDADNPFYRIFLMDMQTGDVEPISPGVGKTTCAWIHPDSQRVLYASTHDDPKAQQKMQAELDFRASGKERRYSWDYDPAYEIYSQELNSGERRNLTNTPGYDAEGAYSPDGSQIVFASNRRAYSGDMSPGEKTIFEHDKSFMMDLYIMNADGSDVRRLTDAPGYDGGPFFSFDGKKITWRRFSEDGSRAEIYTMDLASGEETQLTSMGVMSWAPFFHPSGEYLVFATNKQGFANFELYLVDAAGQREPVRVTGREGFDGLPVFLPNGNRIAWTSNQTNGKKSQIFIADWNHSGARRLLGLDAQASAAAPAVSADMADSASAITITDLRRHVDRLTADEMAGRMTGSEGERLATAYVADVFRQLGLAAAGADDSYFQGFEFTAGARAGDNNRLAVGGLEPVPAPQPGQDWLPLALSRGGEVASAPVVFAGYGISAPGAENIPEYDSYADLDVNGKWVMLMRYQPESVSPERRRHLLHYSDLAYKASVAKQHGALGIIVAKGPTATGTELVKLRADAGSATTSIAGISITDALAERLLAASGRELRVLQAALDDGEPQAGFEITGITLGAEIDVLRNPGQGRNVLARLDTGNPDGGTPLVIGAHIDHLGHGESQGSLATEQERGAIHPGADDNASGVAAMLETAQYLADLQAKGKLGARRDILFAAWSGEELGTLGSTHFVEQLAGKGDLRGKVSAYLNMDMVGHLRDKLYLQGIGSSDTWAREIERRNVPVGLAIATKADPYLPTDTTPFYLKGVPVLNAFTGAHEDYSTPRDTADNLNFEGMRDIARLMAGIGRSQARSAQSPAYLEVSRKKGGIARKHLRAYLGTIPAYGQDESVKGVKLQGAVKNGPAEKAGVRNGDVLIGLGGVEVETIHDFMRALGGLKAGETTTMKVLRDGKPLQLNVVPGARE